MLLFLFNLHLSVFIFCFTVNIRRVWSSQSVYFVQEVTIMQVFVCIVRLSCILMFVVGICWGLKGKSVIVIFLLFLLYIISFYSLSINPFIHSFIRSIFHLDKSNLMINQAILLQGHPLHLSTLIPSLLSWEWYLHFYS